MHNNDGVPQELCGKGMFWLEHALGLWFFDCIVLHIANILEDHENPATLTINELFSGE